MGFTDKIRKAFCTSVLGWGLWAPIWPLSCNAQMSFDGTLSKGELVGPDYQIDEAHGMRVGGNLFHSFREFNIGTGESATFTGSGSIQNILSRVTGGNLSTIKDKIISKIPGANFFLMNPAGILFDVDNRADTRSDISGSFVVTTADFIELADGARFNALPGVNDQLLTAAPPAAFGFLSENPAGIRFLDNIVVDVKTDQSIGVIGGDISHGEIASSSPGGRLLAPSGQIAMVSVASPGKVTWDINDPLARVELSGFSELGNIGMFTSVITVRDRIFRGGGGRIVMRGGKLRAEGATIVESVSFFDDDALGVDIAVSDSLEILNNSRFSAETGGSGPGTGRGRGKGAGGEIRIDASKIVIDGQGNRFGDFETGLFTTTLATENGGKAGDIVVKAGSLQLQNGGAITSFSEGSGAGGALSIQAKNVAIDGQGGQFPTGLFAETNRASNGGNAGDIDLSTEVLNMHSGGVISTSSFGSGTGGNMKIQAGQVLIDGQNHATGLFAGSIKEPQLDSTGFGDAGGIELTAESLGIYRGGIISNTTSSDGAGTNVLLITGDILINGQGSDLPTGVFAGTTLEQGGNAGNIGISTRSLSLIDGGKMISSTLGRGAGGNIQVSAQDIVIDGQGTRGTGLTSETLAEIGGGDAGNISISVGSLKIQDAGVVSTATKGNRAGGSIQIAAQSIVIDGQGTHGTGLISETFAEIGGGDAGNIFISAGSLKIQDAGVVSTATKGNGTGGNIQVAAQNIVIDGKGNTTRLSAETRLETGGGNAGSIFLDTDELAILEGGIIAAVTFGGGSGGDIQVEANEVQIDGKYYAFGTGIVSSQLDFGGTGDSGNIIFKAQDLELQGGPRAAISTGSEGFGNAGSVTVNVDSLTIREEARISSSAIRNGKAGRVTVNSRGDISLHGKSKLHVFSERSDAGDLTVKTSGSLDLQEGSFISANAELDGGNITIRVGDMIRLSNSEIVAEARGNGGNVSLEGARAVLLDDSRVSANAIRGHGGSISISSDILFVNGDSSLTASSEFGVDGKVRIDSIFDLSSTIPSLSGTLIDASSHLEEGCWVKVKRFLSDIKQQQKPQIPLLQKSGPIGLPPQPATYQLSQRLVPLQRDN